jgi:nitrogen regulatory protein PII
MDKTISSLVQGKEAVGHDLIIAVVGRGFSDYVVSAARDAGATGATIIYGRGTSDYDRQVMGILLQPEREVVMILVKTEDRKKIMKEIVDKTSVIEEGRGVCFSIPVNQVYGLERAEKHKKAQMKRAKQLAKANEDN